MKRPKFGLVVADGGNQPRHIAAICERTVRIIQSISEPQTFEKKNDMHLLTTSLQQHYQNYRLRHPNPWPILVLTA